MPLSVVILAAGQGKRMHSSLPKVLQPLAGRPLLEHVVSKARALTPDAIHIVYGHGGEAVRAACDARDLLWHEQSEQLGTGHAVAQALPEIPDARRVLVLYGDVPLIELASLEALLACEPENLALLTAELDDPRGYGRVVRDDLGSVVRIVEEQDASPIELEVDEINTGILAAPAELLRDWIARLDNVNAQGEYYLTDIVRLAVRDGRPVVGITVDEAVRALGINDKLQLAVAERRFQLDAAEQLLREGASIADPARIDIRGRVQIGRDVFIDVGTVFLGDVHLGDGCQIGPNVVIRESNVGARTVVHANSVIEESHVGPDCEIGPFARLRPDTELIGQVKVGNFVEIKRSRIEGGSKVNHLSYIGDTTVGADVNVGAGTITCNYDGANKHRTVIGDRAFIGSGVNLVAPIEVGADATIGAGSTLTKDTPQGGLTIARVRAQVTVEGWKRPQKKT